MQNVMGKVSHSKWMEDSGSVLVWPALLNQKSRRKRNVVLPSFSHKPKSALHYQKYAQYYKKAPKKEWRVVQISLGKQLAPTTALAKGSNCTVYWPKTATWLHTSPARCPLPLRCGQRSLDDTINWAKIDGSKLISGNIFFVYLRVRAFNRGPCEFVVHCDAWSITTPVFRYLSWHFSNR